MMTATNKTLYKITCSKEEASICDAFNERLKTITTYDEFVLLKKEMAEQQFDCYFYGKQQGYRAYSFTHLGEHFPDGDIRNTYRWNKVHYLYEDGASEGRSDVKNLHRVLRVGTHGYTYFSRIYLAPIKEG